MLDVRTPRAALESYMQQNLAKCDRHRTRLQIAMKCPSTEKRRPALRLRQDMFAIGLDRLCMSIYPANSLLC
jgi:hypothetical protein